MWFKKKKPVVNVTVSDTVIDKYEKEIVRQRDRLSEMYEHQARLIAQIKSSDETIENILNTINNALEESDKMPTAAEKYGMLSSYLYHSTKVISELHKKL